MLQFLHWDVLHCGFSPTYLWLIMTVVSHWGPAQTILAVQQAVAPNIQLLLVSITTLCTLGQHPAQ